jgi:hypothetical protein
MLTTLFIIMIYIYVENLTDYLQVKYYYITIIQLKSPLKDNVRG